MYSSYRNELQRLHVTRFEQDLMAQALRLYARELRTEIAELIIERGWAEFPADLENTIADRRSDLRAVEELHDTLDDAPF